MNILLSLIVLAAGLVLLVYGIMSNDAFASHVSRVLTGHPTDRTMWMLIGGGVLTLVGIVGLVRARKD